MPSDRKIDPRVIRGGGQGLSLRSTAIDQVVDILVTWDREVESPQSLGRRLLVERDVEVLGDE